MKEIPADLLKEITAQLVEAFDPEAVYLFGSHAWGEPFEDSDLDFLVVVRDSELSPAKRSSCASKALGEVVVPVDVLVRTSEEVAWANRVYASLISQILDEGKCLWTKPSANLLKTG